MKKFIKNTLGALLLSTVLIAGTALCAFAAEATVNDDGTRIRSDSNTSSNVVTTASKGTSYTVLDTVTGSDGNTWYQIQVNDSTTGYVRGDLVTVSGDVTASAGDSEPSEVTSSAPATAINPVTATIKDPSVNIRSGAGTDYDKVGSLTSGTSITLTAEAQASDGQTWYQMTGGGIEGYVRSDFITLDEGQEITYAGDTEYTEGEDITAYVEDTPYEEEPVVNNDYEIVYTTDDDGVYQYYLYDHINNTKQKVPELLSAVDLLNTKYLESKTQLTTFKILTIVFGALAVVAIALCVFLFIRLRGSYEEEYYEDDFEEEPEEAPVRRKQSADTGSEVREKKRPAAEETARPARERSGERSAERSTARERSSERGTERSTSRERSGERSTERSTDRTARASSAEERPREAKRTKRPQNFLADDDEFEFEFLNMDE